MFLQITMPRILIISVAVLVALGLGVGIYFIFFTSAPGVSVAPIGSTSLPTVGQASTQAVTTGASTRAPNAPTGTPVVVSARLVQISTGPVVAGEAVVNKKPANASSTPEVTVSYIERQSGNVFLYAASTKILTRVNNKTIPGVQSASWLPDASAAFVRYLSGDGLSTINTYSLAATSSNGFFLPQNLSDIAVSSGGILMLSSGVNGSIASLARVDGTRATTLFTTPLTSIRVSFAGKNQYLAYSKPSATLAGDAFLVNSAGHFSRIAGPQNGLVALASPLGKWVLVSYTQNSALQMQLVNTVTGAVLPLPVATIADKCVWAADDASVYCGIPMSPGTSSMYPDDWYQGAISFNDRIWKIDVAGRYAQLVLDFSSATKGSLDATSLAINPTNTMLVFVNKNDGSLWGYSL